MEKSADAELVLRVPEARILAVGSYEKTLLRRLEWPHGNPGILWQAWNDMLGLCAGWRDHPEPPAGLRGSLAAAKPLKS
ncbi:hypothetical protein [Streptomyces sp. PU_AKi4]|uniref:hypothetical protein n=1 Tax=Streptomyces sp. PU_AKi4 TaxID=2800809 RepID=UPI0035255890